MSENEELVEVFSSTSTGEAELLRGHLEAEGIPATVDGASQGGFAGVLEVRVLVRALDSVRARAIIEEHEIQLSNRADGSAS